MKTLRLAFVTMACSISYATCAYADPKPVNIPPGDLTVALESLAKQTGVELVYQTDQLKGLTTKGASGILSPQEAVAKLLDGTPLSLRTDASGAMLIATPRVNGDSKQKSATPATTAVQNPGTPTRLAQAGVSEGSRPSDTTSARSNVSERAQDRIELEEIVVTGTHIRGASPIGSPLIVVSRAEIDASGRGRIQDFLETLPQNFSGSASEDANTDAGARNMTRGQAIDLRGLGASSTLVLLNGRRMAPGGIEGAFADISSVPMAAIDRVEVLTDGASALYGADAIGGVVNFITKTDYSGAEITGRFANANENSNEEQVSVLGGTSWSAGGNAILSYQYYHRDPLEMGDTFYGSRNGDFRAFGGSDFRIPGGNPGLILDSAGVPRYQIPQGQDGSNLTAADLIPITAPTSYRDDVTGIELLPEQESHNVFATISQPIGDRVRIFGQAHYSHRDMDLVFAEQFAQLSVPVTNAFYLNPFGTGPVRVNYSLSEDLGKQTQSSTTETYSGAVGTTVELGGRWQVTGSVAYAREDNSWRFNNLSSARLQAALTDANRQTALNVFGDGSHTNPQTLEAIRNTELANAEADVASVDIVADGPLFELPAGPVRLAVGAAYRDEALMGARGNVAPATGTFTRGLAFVGEADRQVSAGFAEMVLPLARSAVSGLPLFEAAVAGRYEDYSDFGSTFNPKVGLNFLPVEAVKLRASWGTSFRAPRLNEITPTARPSFAGLTSGPDPTSPTGTTSLYLLTGTTPSLTEETAEVWTAGFDLTSLLIEGLSFSATYFDIDYEDKIMSGGNGSNTLAQESRWRDVVTRNPTPEQLQAICNDPNIRRTAPCPLSVGAIIDTRLRNLGGLRVRGTDFDIRQRLSLGETNLGFGLALTYVVDYETAGSSTSPFLDNVNTTGFPLRLRARGTANWERGSWRASASLNYANSYDDVVGNRSVDAWTTVDFSVAYEFSVASMLGQGALQFAAINVLDEEPPFVNATLGYDGTNASQVGRALSLTLTKRF
jgi:outer membrane receptor protein involved in Fe transport